MDGKFISFEGPDGAGKTSVMRQITADLQKQLGLDGVLYTREPGGNRIAEQIRDVLFDARNIDMDSRTEALLFAAARRQHLVADIMPALKSGKVILCDRYVDSSIAYQGAGRGLGEDNIWRINQFAIDGLMPELTIYLDIDSELGLQRIAQNRADEVNRLDEEKLSFHRKVRSAYQKLAQENPQRIVTIDASQPLDQVILQVQQAIHQRFSQLF